MTLRAAFCKLEQQNAELLFEREVVECVVNRLSHSSLFNPAHLRVSRSSIDKTSGDVLFCAFGPYGDQHIMLGDFTGHGLTAAIGGPIVSDIFYSRTAMGCTMEQIVTEINQVLCEKLPNHMFMVGCCISINASRSEATVWNCAMPDLLLFRDGNLAMSIESDYLPRGILMRPEKPGTVLHLNQGDLLFAYTDGIVEEQNIDNVMFGKDNLVNILSSVVAGRPLETVLDVLKSYRGGRCQRDDIIIIELTC